MNLQEFAALKVGDKIENPMLNSMGTVSEVTKQGVRIAWEGSRSAITFQYTVQNTSWFHWSKIAEAADDPR